MLHTNLVYNIVVQLYQFFGCGEKWFSKWEHRLIFYEQFLRKVLIRLLYYDPLTDVCIL
jgi:hypothetical protein